MSESIPQESREEFLAQVLHGLAQRPKILYCKHFYDQRGSRLFDRICELPEYYPTRTEMAIMRAHAPEMAAALGPGVLLVEYGSGSSLKTPLLLDQLDAPAAYVPIDISCDHLHRSAADLAAAYPRLRIVPLCADYTQPFKLPPIDPAPQRTAVYFPGSTIGNFHPEPAVRFLQRIADLCGRDGGLLIGVDLRKDPVILEAAYNDSAGVTAAFNLNLLERINRELSADFNIDRFAHRAFYNRQLGRIEMHLVSLEPQSVHIGGQTFTFERGETIRTESSYKYDLDGFARLAAKARFTVRHVWTDPERLFSVQYLSARPAD